jgi:oxepin-CoA hydrolase/3-oxo-5,6-dehydrosuberyl-CoA semialdehyde dehydrogenase
MRLQSFALERWHTARTDGAVVRNAITGDPVAEVSSDGLDFGAMLDHGRGVGGPALRRMTFHQRALMLKALGQALLERKEELYALSRATGATRTDSWIDIEGGIGTLFAYSSRGRRELPNATFLLDGDPEVLSKAGSFVGQHLCVPLEGVAVHINAFNFPCWGMLEKLSTSLLAGVASIVKPASQTAYLTELMFRRMIESGVLPEGAVQLVCGSAGDLFEHLTGQDVVTFTGSAATGRKLKQHPSVIEHAVRFTMEADSLNASILGPDAQPGTDEFDLFVKEVAREMTVKAGQKCTAIRRAFVPASLIDAVGDALATRLSRVVIGDPGDATVTMGALASLDQRAEVRLRIAELAGAARIVHGDPQDVTVVGADARRGAFLSPVLLRCDDPHAHDIVHDVEAFGPVSTLMPYATTGDAIALAKRGKGSLVASIFTRDDAFARDVVLGVAAHHGRLLVVNRDCAKESTGHGSPLPGLVHGGPGRAGGGEELGGVRDVLHYLQRTAVQGSPATLTAVGGRWLPGAPRTAGIHPFRKTLDELEIGDAVLTAARTITLDDIEHFAHFTGDRFYAHMDEAAAKANPLFGGRVAHGYFIVSVAAGLFVDPDPGPVLANYGVDHLRFMTPVKPGDTLQCALTCTQKTPRETEPYGEVRWDCTVTNQEGKVVAQYDVLTLVAKKAAAAEGKSVTK